MREDHHFIVACVEGQVSWRFCQHQIAGPQHWREFLMGLYKVSLAWKMREESCDREMVVRGFMLMENSRGPRMEPLGTFEVTA